MKRICLLGASTVEGMGDSSRQGWAGRLIRNETDQTVLYNLGIRGQTLEQISARAVAECKVRILDFSQGGIVLCCGVNDLARLADGSPRTTQEATLAILEVLIAELRAIAPLIATGPFPVAEEKMPFHSSASGATLHFRNEDIARADRIFDGFFADRDVPYLGLYSSLLQSEVYQEGLLKNDGLHPDSSGYQVIADRVAGWSGWRDLIT